MTSGMDGASIVLQKFSIISRLVRIKSMRKQGLMQP